MKLVGPYAVVGSNERILIFGVPFPMRTLTFILLFVAAGSVAQPGMPRFTFTLAKHAAPHRPFTQEHRVEQHYQELVRYEGMQGSYAGPKLIVPLTDGSLFTDAKAPWQVYAPVEGEHVGSYLLVIAASDTMRMDLPEHMEPLRERAYERWDRETPEVIRFRKGHYALEELLKEPRCTKAANQLALRLIAAEKAAYAEQLKEQEAYYRAQPPPVPPRTTEPPHTPTQEEIESEIAQRPGLIEVNVDSVVDGNVWVRISGRVMLNGACASGMPLYGVELRTDTNWVERIPFELIQMDCGMPWADWTDHPVMIPLAWWVRANSREGQGELVPGNYRLVFMGANMQRMPTPPFWID